MFVHPAWTRRGLGRRIIQECERAAWRDGYRRLGLLATLAGVPLYLACGFRPLEEVEVSLTDGVIVRCVSMDKPIDPPRYADDATPVRESGSRRPSAKASGAGPARR
jgi:hypothetical protein